MAILAALTSVSKGQTLEFWHFSEFTWKAAKYFGLRTQHKVLKGQASGEGGERSQKESKQNALSRFNASWVAFLVLINIKANIFLSDLDSKLLDKLIRFKFNNEYLNLGLHPR